MGERSWETVINRLLDAPGARALNQIRLLLLELFHHEGDGFFRTFHRGDQAASALLSLTRVAHDWMGV